MIGWGRNFQVTGLSRREPGAGAQVRVRVQDLIIPVPVPDNQHLRPEGRDLGPGNVSHVCTFAQAVGRFALLHLGQHVLPPLPFPFTALGADIA